MSAKINTPFLASGWAPRFLAYRVWPMMMAALWATTLITGGSTGDVTALLRVIGTMCVIACLCHATFPLSTTARYGALFLSLLAAFHRIIDVFSSDKVTTARAITVAAVWLVIAMAKFIIFRLTMPLVDYDLAKRGERSDG